MINKPDKVENITRSFVSPIRVEPIKELGLRQLDLLDFAGGPELGWP